MENPNSGKVNVKENGISCFDRLSDLIARFNAQRKWSQYHSPKNLVMALSVEVAELVEHFQWKTETESNQLDDEALEAVSDEIADVQIYLIQLADRLAIDIKQSVELKITKNALKHPAEGADR